MTEVFVQRIAHLQMEAFGLSFSDKIGSVVQKGIGVAHAFIKNETIEDLKLTMKSLHHERNDVFGWDKNRDDPMRKQIYALCESLEIILNCKLAESALQPESLVEATEIVEETTDAANSGNDIVVESGMNPGTVAKQPHSDCIQPPEEINGQQLRLGIPIDDMAASEPANEALNNAPKEEDAIALFERSYDGEMKEEYVDELMETIGELLQPTPLEDYSITGIDENGKTLDEGDEVNANETEHPVNETETKRTARNPRKRTIRSILADQSMEEAEVEDEEAVEKEEDNNNIENDYMDDSDGSYHPIRSRGVNSTPRRPKNKRKRSSKISGKSVKNRSHLKTPKNEETTPHEETVRPFKCDQCSCSYTRVSQLKLHIRAAHAATEEARKPFQCTICGKRSIKNSDLRRHMKVHSNDLLVKRPHQCNNCKSRFYAKAGLKIHSTKCM